jgi:hypothetical protein
MEIHSTAKTITCAEIQALLLDTLTYTFSKTEARQGIFFRYTNGQKISRNTDNPRATRNFKRMLEKLKTALNNLTRK